jgi:hypothetical protein
MLFEALLHELEALARNWPVLMVFEDAHWIDPTSRELLDLILDRVSRLPILVIITFRSEFQHAWSGQPHVTGLAFEPARRAGWRSAGREAGRQCRSRPRDGRGDRCARRRCAFVCRGADQGGARKRRPCRCLGSEPVAGAGDPAPVHPTLAHRTPLGRRSGRDRPRGSGRGRDQLANRHVERDAGQNAGYFAEEAGAARSLQLLSP